MWCTLAETETGQSQTGKICSLDEYIYTGANRPKHYCRHRKEYGAQFNSGPPESGKWLSSQLETQTYVTH